MVLFSADTPLLGPAGTFWVLEVEILPNYTELLTGQSKECIGLVMVVCMGFRIIIGFLILFYNCEWLLVVDVVILLDYLINDFVLSA